MPTINKLFYLDVTPEKYLEACSPKEIIETWLLISSERFQSIIKTHEDGYNTESCEVSNELMEGDRSLSPSSGS